MRVVSDCCVVILHLGHTGCCFSCVTYNNNHKGQSMDSFPRLLTAIGRTRTPVMGFTLVALAGCFSGSGSSSDSDGRQQGRFIDGPVSGLSFATPGRQGKTDDDGRFSYEEGESVSFSVGGIELGSAAGRAVITPADLIPDAGAGDAAVLNIARLLQSLDADGNLLNGIQISAAMDEAIGDYVEAQGLQGLDFNDADAFEHAMAGLFAQWNTAGVFDENADNRQRALRDQLQAWRHLQDSLAVLDGEQLRQDVRPVLFIHGGAGSASQFESQAQRFRANGYPLGHLAVYEYNTATGQDPFDPAQAAERNAQINTIIDQLLLSTGADKVHLMGHSMGTRVRLVYLSEQGNAAKGGEDVSIDGTATEGLPGGVPTLGLGGQDVG